MKQIDEASLESDVMERYQYLTDFIGFGESDVQIIHNSAEVLGPLVPGMVDAIYDKLFSLSATKRHFVERQHGYEGELPQGIDNLELDHEMIAFRKSHLTDYLVTLVTKPYNKGMVSLLDYVGKIHTSKAGNKSLDIPLIQMNSLMGFVSDAFLNTIFSLNLPRDSEIAAARAFNKLLWIQSDLITRHYQG
jgi:hypothetical protein